LRLDASLSAEEVDTVRASLSGSEDSSEHVSAYLRAVGRVLATVPGAAALLVHHAGWQDGEGKRPRERGSSAWRGNVDGTLYIEAGKYDQEHHERRLILRTLKVRDGGSDDTTPDTRPYRDGVGGGVGSGNGDRDTTRVVSVLW
jgi:hypothetical protein